MRIWVGDFIIVASGANGVATFSADPVGVEYGCFADITHLSDTLNGPFPGDYLGGWR